MGAFEHLNRVNNMENFNPWLSIWRSPRATIARIVAENPNRSLWLLAFIYGFASMMNTCQSVALGNAMSPLAILILSALIAPFYGYISFSVWSWFVSWVGKWFKGQGNFKQVRAAYAWSVVPISLNIPLWLLMVILFGHQLFMNFPDAPLLSNAQVTLLFAILIVKVVLAIWSLVIYINGLAEVQQYSILRALLNVVVAGIILSIILCVLWSLLIYAMGGVAVSGFTILKPF